MIFAAAILAKLLWIESDWGWALVAAAAVVDIGETFLWLWWSRRKRARVGAEAMVGQVAVVLTPCAPDGQVRLRGEIWKAHCETGAEVDDRVTVEAVDGLTLIVRRAA